VKHTKKLLDLPEKELIQLGQKGKDALEEKEGREVEKIRKDRYVS
jgi:hypothetical protein